ncbi:hypothetical protein LAB1_13310 [Roseibium sp. LAB1]
MRATAGEKLVKNIKTKYFPEDRPLLNFYVQSGNVSPPDNGALKGARRGG